MQTQTQTPASEAITTETIAYFLEGDDTEYATHEAAVAAADDSAEGLETDWHTVTITRRWTLLDADGEVLETADDDSTEEIKCPPREPACTHADGHDWQQPHALVGGLREFPGEFSSGGGMRYEHACLRCGCGYAVDTWGQHTIDGSQGHRVESYAPGEYADEIAQFEADE